jgi:hypothetical protein
MTKYILNSGGWRNYPDRAKEFFAEICKDQGSNPKMLLCFFAVPREDWDTKYAENQERINAVVPAGVQPMFDLAYPATFAQQVAASDIIYISGGDDHLLMYWLRQFDLPKLFAGKVIATSSASSHALSTHFWTCDWRMCLDGLGILPIKFLAHYNSAYGSTDRRGPIDWEAAKAELEKYGDAKLPLHALEEGRFVVIQ